MKCKTKLAVLLLSATLIASPSLSGVAHAHENGAGSGHATHCEHWHMSKDKIELLHATFKKFHDDNKETFEDVHKLHQALRAVLAAPNFDKDTYLSLTKQIQERRNQLEMDRALAFASIADKFTPEERTHVGKSFGHHSRHHHRHGGWHHHDGVKEVKPQ
jgi:Spy/CpxP family protein refolding chaperone